MRFSAILLFTLFVVGCAGEAETDAEMPAEEAMDSAAGLAAFAGTWQNFVTLEGVADPIPSMTSGSASGTDWTMTLEGRDPIALQVSISGDSLVTQSAEYESILRPGVMTTVRSAVVQTGDSRSGVVVVTYRTPEGEEIVNGTIAGTRVP